MTFLLRRLPNREALVVFYKHSRMFERAVSENEFLGGGFYSSNPNYDMPEGADERSKTDIPTFVEKLETSKNKFPIDMSYEAGFSNAESLYIEENASLRKDLNTEREVKREILLRRIFRQLLIGSF